MQTPETIKSRIQQFQKAVQDPKLNLIIEKLLTEAFEKAFDVQIADKPSQHKPVPISGGCVHFIFISSALENKRAFIYDLMHEMGHLFDEVPRDVDCRTTSTLKESELRAWDFADKKFALYPNELGKYEKEYFEHRKKMLGPLGQ